jgi:hypothetical protein
MNRGRSWARPSGSTCPDGGLGNLKAGEADAATGRLRRGRTIAHPMLLDTAGM